MTGPALDATFVVRVDPGLYTDREITKAAYWFSDVAYVSVGRDNVGFTVSFQSKGGKPLPQSLTSQFENALLEEKVRRFVREETAGLREAIFKAAFPVIPPPTVPID